MKNIRLFVLAVLQIFKQEGVPSDYGTFDLFSSTNEANTRSTSWV